MFSEFQTHRELRNWKEYPPTWVNVGEPPKTGVIETGHTDRKDVCEDVKVNDPQKGLFLVADGVSLSSGAFASFETARIVNEQLGESLDEQIEGIVQSESIDLDRKMELIDALVRADMRAAILEADTAIRTRAQTDSTIGSASTTLSLTKLVAMPDKTQRLFYTNVGDSRIYQFHQRKLIPLTQDDSYLTEALKTKKITPEQAKKVDQAGSVDEVPEGTRFLYQNRNRVTRVVGNLQGSDVVVESMNVLPGMRLLIASDGLTDQLREGKLAFVLTSQQDDRAAERELQKLADDMAIRGTDPRAKADDISGIVVTIGAEGPDRSYVHKKETHSLQKEVTKEMVEIWRSQIPRLEQQVRSGRNEGQDTKTLEQELARNEFWVAHMDLQELESSLPARFKTGDLVRVKRPEAGSLDFDRVLWKIGRYDADSQRYLISHPSGVKHLMVDRFSLELWQPEISQQKEVVKQLQQAKALKKQMALARKQLT